MVISANAASGGQSDGRGIERDADSSFSAAEKTGFFQQAVPSPEDTPGKNGIEKESNHERLHTKPVLRAPKLPRSTEQMTVSLAEIATKLAVHLNKEHHVVLETYWECSYLLV
jgi:hypothetical protein